MIGPALLRLRLDEYRAILILISVSPDVGAVAKQSRISVPIADPEADGAAQYRP